MFTVKSKEEFIADIRALSDDLKNVRLNGISVSRKEKSIRYDFISEKTISDELKKLMLAEAEKITLPAFGTVTITVKKIVCDSELITNAIINFLSSNYPSLAIFLKQTDVVCKSIGESEVRYVLKMTKDSIDYVVKSGVLYKLNDHLSKNFCSDFIGACEEKEPEETVSLLEEEVFISELQKIQHRTIKVKDIVIIDDLYIGNVATYIEDMKHYGPYTVCGKVTEIVEKKTKTDKPMFIIHIDDTTGETSGVYFPRKATIQKIKDITVGECIIATGELSERDGKPSFRFNKINRCTFPEDFVKKEKYKKSAPKNYSLIYPSSATTIKVKTVFDVDAPPTEELMQNQYVVFDLETTGLDLMSNGITEIGAVKIINGKIKEQWTTLVKADYTIDEENFKITGISNEMIKDSPRIGQVIPDFMKFIDGAILVAQNSEFDMKFLKRFVTAEEYDLKNKVMDTMVMARKYLPQLRNHDLATLADHYGIVFNHHRALNDAYATAEIFIELMKIKAEKGE